MRVSTPFLLLLLLMIVIPKPATALPVIDGKISSGEWDHAELHIIELTTGVNVNLSIIYTTTTVYYLAVIDHSNPTNKINLDPSSPHDYFGIEFDNNKDDAIMGTRASPDDTIIVNYEKNYGADMFMHSFKAFYDTAFGGTNDCTGKAGSDGTNLIFEIAKPLISHDERGHDISLSQGDQYQIMVAFWDDQPARSAIAGFNIRIDNEQFLTLLVNTQSNFTSLEIVSSLVFLMSLAIAYYISRYGLDQLFDKFKGNNI